jgi:hypothetical protein
MDESAAETIRWLVDRAQISESTNHQITVTGDTAVSRSYLHAVHVRESPFDHWDAGGWYDCSYARTPEGWKFTRVRLTVVWLAGDPGEGVTKVRR